MGHVATSTSATTLAIGIAVTVAVAVAGCSAPGSTSADRAPRPIASESTAMPSGSPMPPRRGRSDPTDATTPGPSPTPWSSSEAPSDWRPTNLPTDPTEARDGQNLDACYDGECQVTVHTGDWIPIHDILGTHGVEVTDVKNNLITLDPGGKTIWATRIRAVVHDPINSDYVLVYVPLMAAEDSGVLDIRIMECLGGAFPGPTRTVQC